MIQAIGKSVNLSFVQSTIRSRYEALCNPLRDPLPDCLPLDYALMTSLVIVMWMFKKYCKVISDLFINLKVKVD